MAKVISQVCVVCTNSQVLFKKHIKHSEPDTMLLEFIASTCLDDGTPLDQSSIAEVLIDKSFTETIVIDKETTSLLNMEEMVSLPKVSLQQVFLQ